jgi:hypothetical protein
MRGRQAEALAARAEPDSRSEWVRNAMPWLVLLSVLLIFAPTLANSSAYSEAKTKAGFLLNFTRFVDWPDSSFSGDSAPFVICVLNDSEFAATAADVIGDRRVDHRSISIEQRADVERASDCHIFFVPEAQAPLHQILIERTSGRSVFTISEAAGFAEMGGIANFIRSDEKLRLEINGKAAKEANLKVSARLLRIADVVG